ncbi:hypothetical protein DBR32_11795 [Taibaiella sp. KBW10]|uniref:YceI family protein n=1 Tax=Taibaiella sp. KBW10 TaxID=2153357 RepID=UPI000F5A6FA0|nr:YceI family protein [Taibaiella sp. KBW10]RQO30251.1 hypothetical protein DBR32_11795 [Taibaiella sp. KBW10]
MKKLLIFAAVSSLAFTACKNTEGDAAKTAETQEVAKQTGSVYNLDAAGSSIKWTAYHKGGLNPRFGIIKAAGTVSVEKNAITGGSFTIDMNSLTTDTAAVAAAEGKKSTDLDMHLKGADFFDVAKYPNAKFEITGVTAFDSTKVKSVIQGATNIVSGNLTLKDKTVNVTFPAKVNVTESEITVESKFVINRSDWGLSYKTEGNPADWGISKDIEIQMNVKAKK